MNIIFGRDQAMTLAEKYTVLELDTIRVSPSNKEITAFCVIESIPIMDMPKVESMKNLHENLLIEYKKKNWNYCIQALEYLTGFWGHEIDTFYDNIGSRIQNYSENDPGDTWDGVIVKLDT
jgi:hypothetical protein